MDIVYLKDEKITELILYALEKENITEQDIKGFNIKSIIYDYKGYYYVAKQDNITIDTFTSAACLMIAINSSNITKDKIVNASIAINAAAKLCEEPYIENLRYKTLVLAPRIDIEDIYENDPDLFNYWTKSMFEGLMFENESIEQYREDLKTFHEVTTRIYQNKKEDKSKIKQDKLTITYV